jgi:CRP-like cAMP-binding protein
MKRLVKRVMRGCWHATFPLRRPLIVRTEAFLRRCLPSHGESTIVLDHVVRELVRLQDQVAALHETLDEIRAAREPLMIVRSSDRDRMKAG